MKRLLTLLMLLSMMTACEKYDWAPQLESGKIDLTRSTIEGYWKCSVKNIVEYYDANGDFIDYERLIGGMSGATEIYMFIASQAMKYGIFFIGNGIYP